MVPPRGAASRSGVTGEVPAPGPGPRHGAPAPVLARARPRDVT